mmetsp:Transcript_114770/g.180731  ORF Transcript_114770/g.180731 Transcript_114770/m.180731 type:complete len:469 (-) Transcript_114770:170-1576(-)
MSDRAMPRQVRKELCMAVGLTTTAFVGGGLIFGFSPFAKQLTELPGSPFKPDTVADVFAIGHNITAWGCIASGLLLDRFGPRVCAVSGLVMEATAHIFLMLAGHLPAVVTIVAYGVVGLGGTQVLLAALTFTDSFKSSALINAALTGAFQAGGFVFILLRFVPWERFFLIYACLALAGALVTGFLYPDDSLPAVSRPCSIDSTGSTEMQSPPIEEGDAATIKSDSAHGGESKEKVRLTQLLSQPRVLLFLLTFCVAGNAVIYGSAVFLPVLQTKDLCRWDATVTIFTDCKHQDLQDMLNDVAMPLVGNFIIPVALLLGHLIDKTGFALPAFVNIFSVQAFIASLWLLGLEGQFLTLAFYNVANAAVFTIQNAYVCAVGHDHIGTLFALTNFVLGLGNILSDWFSSNPFGEGESEVMSSLRISSVSWLVATSFLYVWVVLEIFYSLRLRRQSFQEESAREALTRYPSSC